MKITFLNILLIISTEIFLSISGSGMLLEFCIYLLEPTVMYYHNLTTILENTIHLYTYVTWFCTNLATHHFFLCYHRVTGSIFIVSFNIMYMYIPLRCPFWYWAFYFFQPFDYHKTLNILCQEMMLNFKCYFTGSYLKIVFG